MTVDATGIEGAAAPLLSFSDFRVDFPRGPAVRGIDLTVARGEALGIVGESGSGKSVTWLAALGLLGDKARVGGKVRFEEHSLTEMPPSRLARLRGGRIAMIFQDPMSALNPVKRIGSQVAEVLALHRGITGRSARAETVRLFDLVGLPNPARRIDLFPHELSGGQNQRVAIAMALAGQPDLLIADEPTTALDVTIQAQILTLLDDLRRGLGMALVLISHDLSVVGELCDRIAVCYAGKIVESAPVADILRQPAHPYTAGLIAAAPRIGAAQSTLVPIPGQVPEPWNMPEGCAFAPRCLHARTACMRQPELTPTGRGSQLSACVLTRALSPTQPQDEVSDVSA